MNIKNFMKCKTISAALIAACFLIAGCSDSPSSAPAPAAAKTPVTIEAITAEAKGFTFGSPMSVRTVYVFFDAQCPHCGTLWYAAKPLKSQAKFIWIPVGILNAASTSQGAAILAAADPVAAMDSHETSMLAKSGGISEAANTETQKDAIKKNTLLMNRFRFASIPSVVAVNAKTGAVVTHEGALPTAELADFLGLQVPTP